MTDPRVERTRLHVLGVARTLLSDPSSGTLTLSRLAKSAKVSRKTLYTHWGRIDNVISDAVIQLSSVDPRDFEGMSPRERVRGFLRSVRDGLHDPVTRAAMCILMSQAGSDPDVAASLSEMKAKRTAQLVSLVGPVADSDYAQLVGPIFFAEFITLAPITDEGIDELADRATDLLGLTR